MNIGESFERAGPALGLESRLLEPYQAYASSLWAQRFDNWFRGRRPRHLTQFSDGVLAVCRSWRPDALVALGLAPIEGGALAEIGELGVSRINYSTDDPWSARQGYRDFFQALPHYDTVFSTRKANLGDFEAAGCRHVVHLPFGYCEAMIYRDEGSAADAVTFRSDVMFYGGADRDRTPYIGAILREGFDLALYGGYWDRFRETRGASRGQAQPPELRKAISGAKVAICLVRRANRDGTCMRSFEVPAIGTCMLTEDTDEHREIFGADGEAVLYFRTPAEMIERLRWLLDEEGERLRLARAAQRRIVDGHNTYRDRLAAMLEGARRSSNGGSGS